MRGFDYSKFKDFKWDSEILSQVAQIHEFRGRQELFLNQKEEVLDKLVEISKIQSIESSNKIEGIVTTNLRIKKLFDDKAVPRNRDEEEILGYKDVLNTIHENYDYISLESRFILQLHRDLYKFSNKSFGGKYKNTQNFITETFSNGLQKEIFRPLEPFETPDAVDSICKNMVIALAEKEVDSLLLIPIFIHDFLCIHPFNDGNGRMSRLLTTLLLYKEGYVVGKYISVEKKIEETKESYYSTLKYCGNGWHEENEDVIPFIKYILSIIIGAYRDFESRVDYFSDKLPAIEQVKNSIDKKIGKFTKSDIMEFTPQISRASVENSLKKLVEDGFIEKYGKGKSTFYARK